MTATGDCNGIDVFSMELLKFCRADPADVGAIRLTERLYYTDSSLLEFEATVSSIDRRDSHVVVSLDRSAFYPSSGGQNFDTGWLESLGNAAKLQITQVEEDERTSEVLHVIDGAPDWLRVGQQVRGIINADRRRDHMQQHSGQHLLSAAFENLSIRR